MSHDFIVQFREAPLFQGNPRYLLNSMCYEIHGNLAKQFEQTAFVGTGVWHCYFEAQNATVTTILLRVGHVVSIAEGHWRHVSHVCEMLFSSSRYVNFIAM